VDSDTTAARFTADQLVSLASENGLQASRRLITDWGGLGLIDRPHHPGLGRGEGSNPGTWSLPQAALFLDLLALRQRPQEPIRHVAALANVPVSGWLWMGDEGGVPLRQVRRALATWCGRHRSRRRASPNQARKITRAILAQIDNPHASKRDRDALRQLLEATLSQGSFDADAIYEAVSRVFDPHQVGRELGPPDARFTAEYAARMLHAQATGYLDLDTFIEREFEDARVIYLAGRRDYATAHPHLTASRNGSPIRFDAPTLENVINDACRNLLFLLGMGRLMPTRHAQLAAEAVHTNRLETDEGADPAHR
jgi:hypothetical protein